MIYIHLNKGHLNMYIHVSFESNRYCDYKVQAQEHIKSYLDDGWLLVSIIFRSF